MRKKKTHAKKLIAICATVEEQRKFDLIREKRGILTYTQVIRSLLNEEVEKILSKSTDIDISVVR